MPMKRTALALHHLIASRFRGDALELIGFGRHAAVMRIEQLTALDAMWDKGTNLHHALLLATGTSAGTPTRSPCCWSSPTASRPRTSSPTARCSSTTRRTR